MRFGERLARERWMPWAVHYFNYELLKRKMKAVMAAQEEQEREERKEDFAKALDTEIEKVIYLLPFHACNSNIPLLTFKLPQTFHQELARLSFCCELINRSSISTVRSQMQQRLLPQEHRRALREAWLRPQPQALQHQRKWCGAQMDTPVMPHSAKKILHPLQSAIERESSALMSPSLAVLVQLDHLDNSLRSLRPISLDIFHLLGYVSLNTAALRKILKKYAKNVEPTKPQPGVAHTLPPAPQSLRRKFSMPDILVYLF